MSASYQAWLKEKLVKLQDIECYSAGITPEQLANQIGVNISEIVKLNFNENFFVERQKQAALLKELADEIDLRLYPEDEEAKLRKKLVSYVGLSEDYLAISNAGDELIDRLVRLFIEKGDAALSFAPSFTIPQLCVKRQDCQYITVPLKTDFQLDMQKMLSLYSEKTRLLYLCSPNNPTANQMKPEDVETLIKSFPGIVILDEAYGEFADYSFIPRIVEFPNLIILRTFSKAFGLAMLRLGYAVANPELASIMRERSPLPYPVSGLTIRMGVKMLENTDIMKKAVSQLVSERGRLIKALNEIHGIEAFPSQADFVLINCQKSADEIHRRLLKRGIMIKKLGKLLQYNNCFRITVGLPDMNAKLIEALKQIQEDLK